MPVKARDFKPCKGLCGRVLARYRFGNNGLNSRCDECHRAIERVRYRTRYEQDEAFREREKARDRARTQDPLKRKLKRAQEKAWRDRMRKSARGELFSSYFGRLA